MEEQWSIRGNGRFHAQNVNRIDLDCNVKDPRLCNDGTAGRFYFHARLINVKLVRRIARSGKPFIKRRKLMKTPGRRHMVHPLQLIYFVE